MSGLSVVGPFGERPTCYRETGGAEGGVATSYGGPFLPKSSPKLATTSSCGPQNKFPYIKTEPKKVVSLLRFFRALPEKFKLQKNGVRQGGVRQGGVRS